MHFLFVTDNFPPETNAPASRTYEHCKRWVSSGHRVTVLTCAPNFPKGKVFPGYRNKLFQRERLDGIEVVRVISYISANQGFIRRTLDYASFMASAILSSCRIRGVDMVIATSPQLFAAVAGQVISRLKGKPFVFELRDLWPESIVALGVLSGSRVIKWLTKLEYYLYRQAWCIVSVTSSYREILSARGIPAGKIHVIPNGADLSVYTPRPKDRELVEKYGLDGKFVVSYIGTLGMAHGLDSLLQAAEKLSDQKDIVFMVIGEGAEKKYLIDMARQMNLANIIFVDGQTKGMIVRFWSVSNATMVLLRKAELFTRVIPSKIAEAFAMEVPVILGVAGEAKELLEKAGAGISIEPENSDALAAAIMKMKSDPDLHASFRKSGRAFVEASYNRDIFAEEMLRVLTGSGNSVPLSSTGTSDAGE